MPILRLPIGIIFAVSLFILPRVDAVQEQRDDWLQQMAPDKCTLYVHWAGLGELNPDGSPTEQWLAQEEIQLALSKLASAIRQYQDLHPINDASMQELLLKVPTLLKDCSGSVYFGIANANLGPDSSPLIGGIVKLNQHEVWATEFLNRVGQSGLEQGVEEKIVDGHRFLAANLDQPDEHLHIGIANGHLIVTFGPDAFAQTMSDLKTPAPAWLMRAREETAVDRALGFFHFDPSDLFAMNRQVGRNSMIPESLRLDDVKSVSGTMGLDNSGFIASMFVACEDSAEGLTGILSAEPMDESFVQEMPAGEMSSAGARISFSALSNIIESSADEMGDESVQQLIREIEEFTGLDFEQEVVASLDDFVFGYQSFSPLTMGTTGVVAFRIKDPDSFSEIFNRFNTELAREVEALELGEFVEKQTNGQTVYSFNRPPYFGPSFSWCHVEDLVYLSGDAKSIRTHLRKRTRTRNRLIDDPRFKESFTYGQSKGWGNPVAFSHVDVATLVELVVPLGATFLAGQEIPDFDFTIEDVPSVDVLTRGVEANVITVFRSPKGIHLIERSTLPGGSTVATSGVAVGMLLPAVQQVRNAARRATATNNLRQLQLALLNYEAVHQSFPPAYTTDEDGKPLLSWRVAILPFLEEQALFEQFHQDEPWDSPHNKSLVKKMPEVFENPSAVIDKGQTTFLGAGGENGVFSGGSPVNLAQVVDGTSRTISILDVGSDNAVDWTAPKDLDPGSVEDLGIAVRGNWPGGLTLMVLVDGSCHAVEGLTHQELLQLMNRRDGKSVDLLDR